MRGYWLFVPALLLALLVMGCDEALFSANTDDGIPNIPDGEGTPWVEFIGDDVVGGAPGDTVAVTVQPGESPGEPVTVEYEISGSAVAGQDYEILSGASPVMIPFDLDDNNLDDADISIRLMPSATAGRSLMLTLTSATTESGQQLDVGRGGEDIDKSRTVEIN